MRFEDALKFEGAQSAGGQLIVNHNGKNVLVGKHHSGMLMVEDTDEAREVMQLIAASTATGDATAANEKAPAKPRAKKAAATAGADTGTGPADAGTVMVSDQPIEPGHLTVEIADEVTAVSEAGGGE